MLYETVRSGGMFGSSKVCRVRCDKCNHTRAVVTKEPGWGGNLMSDKLGAVVTADLLGQAEPCGCGGRSEAARLAITTSDPRNVGFSWERYCPTCKVRAPLDAEAMQAAKDTLSELQPASYGGWLEAGG